MEIRWRLGAIRTCNGFRSTESPNGDRELLSIVDPIRGQLNYRRSDFGQEFLDVLKGHAPQLQTSWTST